MNRQNRIFFILFVFFISSIQAISQTSSDDVEVTLESPYNTILVHLHYLQPETYDPAQAAAVFYNIPDSSLASRRAIQLKQILDGKGLFVKLNTLPTNPNYQDSTLQRNVFTPFPDELPELYLEKIGTFWYYANSSVQSIPAIHKKVYPFGTAKLLNLIPQSGQRKLLGLMLWQWLGLFLLMVIAYLFHFVLSNILNPVIRRLSDSKLYPKLVDKRLIKKLARLFSILILVRLLHIILPILQLPVEINTFFITAFKLAGVLIFAFIGLRIIDVIMVYVSRFTVQTESRMDDQLVPLLTRSLQSVVIVVGIIFALRLFNINVTALIAGLSIGGLALALAAQDTLKNLFGSVTIFFDKPFQIGDAITFGGVSGTVEEVGFRSTRVRTFENSLVYVPNGKLADMTIDNVGLRVYRRFKTTVSLTYDTPPDLIEAYIEGLRAIVENHPHTRKDGFQIHLNEMSADALNILFYTFFYVPDWGAELKAKQEIILAILRLAEKLGVRFAFPTSTIHIEEFPGNGSTTPTYQLDPKATQDSVDQFMEDYKKRLESSADKTATE